MTFQGIGRPFLTGSLVSKKGKPACVLAIDTATRRLSVALVDSSGCIAEVNDESERIHSERLLPAIEATFNQAGLNLEDLTGVALAIGPGSFTGLRIGLATVKGLAFGSSLPIIGVSTLAGLASVVEPNKGFRGALLDAQRGEVYAGWSRGSIGTELSSESVYSTPELAILIPKRAVLAVGEGAESFSESLAKEISVELVANVVSSARRIGSIGLAGLLSGNGVNARDLAPRYLRRAEAEVRLTGRRFE